MGLLPRVFSVSKLPTDQLPELIVKAKAALWAAGDRVNIRLTKSAHGQSKPIEFPFASGGHKSAASKPWQPPGLCAIAGKVDHLRLDIRGRLLARIKSVRRPKRSAAEPCDALR